MKKRYLVTILISVLLLLGASLPTLAFVGGNFGLNLAANRANYVTGDPAKDTVEGIFGRVVTVFLSLMAFFFFFLMMYGGLRWMTARGKEEYIEKGKNIIEAAIIGIILITAAYAIANFVINRLN